MGLRIGDEGAAVVSLQKALGIKADGVFGPHTEEAVKAFQSAHGLPSDGIVGPLTIAAISGHVLPPPVTHPGALLKGADIYHGDNVTSWNLLAQNLSYIFMKASDGTASRDSQFKNNWANAKLHGMVHGAYHFMQWGAGTGQAQARSFKRAVDAAGGIDSLTLPPSCDWEFYPERDPRESDVAVGRAFVEEVAQLFGRKPIIYLSSSTPGSYRDSSWMANYYLWVASYRSVPKVPAPWDHFTFWQNSGSARIPGIGNQADSDLFNGNMDDLGKL